MNAVLDGPPLLVGCGLILYRWSGDEQQILVIREKKAKPLIKKPAGCLSIPFETREPSDVDVYAVLCRCATEELGLLPTDFEMRHIAPQAFRFFPDVEAYDIVTHYGIAEYTGDPKRVFVPQAEDVEIVGWMTVRDLLDTVCLRCEAALLLWHFLVDSLKFCSVGEEACV